MRQQKVRELVQTAVLGVLAYVLMLVRFPLPFMPPFMDFDLSGIPEMAGAFIIGPVAGVFVAAIKILLKLLTTGTTSMFTGEFQNFILSCAYILPAGLLYRKAKSKRGALLGMGLGTVCCTTVAVFSNIYLIIPFYVKLFHMSMDQIVAMTRAVNRFVDSEWKLVALGIVPFNLIKGGVTTALVFAAFPLLLRIAKRGGNDGVF